MKTNQPGEKKSNSMESIEWNFEDDLKSAYKPMDELFDVIMDEDDGYEDFFMTDRSSSRQ